MNRDDYLSNLRETIIDWENELAILQDDAGRQTGDDEDAQETMKDLFRQFETIQSKLDEIDQMSDEDFEEEQEVLDEEIEDFEMSLNQARAQIRDV